MLAQSGQMDRNSKEATSASACWTFLRIFGPIISIFYQYHVHIPLFSVSGGGFQYFGPESHLRMMTACTSTMTLASSGLTCGRCCESLTNIKEEHCWKSHLKYFQVSRRSLVGKQCKLYVCILTTQWLQQIDTNPSANWGFSFCVSDTALEQVKGNTIFDNVIITDDVAEADKFVAKWKSLSEVEKAKKKEDLGKEEVAGWCRLSNLGPPRDPFWFPTTIALDFADFLWNTKCVVSTTK